MVLPLRVPVKLPVTFDPPGVVNKSVQAMLGNAPEVCRVLSHVVLVSKQAKLIVLPDTAVDTQFPTTWADEEVDPSARVVIVTVIVPEKESSNVQVVNPGNTLEKLPEPLNEPLKVVTEITEIVVVPHDEAPPKSTAQTPKVYVPATRGIPVKFPFRSTIMPIGGAPVAKESD